MNQEKLSYETLRQMNDWTDVLRTLDDWCGFENKYGDNANWVAELVKSPNRHYKRFRIAKKSGGYRQIVAPMRPLKGLQQRINVLLGQVYEPDSHAMGFIKGRSIVTNALCHIGKRFVLNIDLKDFFPSISMEQVVSALQDEPFQLTAEAAVFIAKACCYTFPDGKRKLAQGAPTSPILSNIVCQRMDKRMAAFAESFGLQYSRYADDITFSGDHFVFSPKGEFWKRLLHIIDSEGFSINEKKIRLHKRGERQEVTGLIVGEKVNVDKRFIRRLRTILHNWETKGTTYMEWHFHNDPNSAANPMLDPIQVIEGKLNYLRMVRGADDSCYQKLRERFERLRQHSYDWMPEDVRQQLENKTYTIRLRRHYYFKTMKTQKIYNLDMPFDFGKYKGHTIRNLAVGLPNSSTLPAQDCAASGQGQTPDVKNPGYLCWLMENAEWFVMDENAMAFCRYHGAMDEEMEYLNRNKLDYNVSRTLSVGDIVKKELDRPKKDSCCKSDISKLCTGFVELDKNMNGGLERGSISIIAGRPAMGKTTFALTLAKNIAADFGKPLAYFYLEASSEWIGKRLLTMSGYMQHCPHLPEELNPMERKLLTNEVEEKLVNAPLFIDDTAHWALPQLERKILNLYNTHHLKAVIIDDIQLLGASVDPGNITHGIEKALGMLNRVARNTKIAIILTSSLSRNVEYRGGSKRPMLSDMRDSGELERYADVVMMLYRPEYYGISEDEYGPCSNIAEIIIAKNRFGSIGVSRLHYGKNGTFGNLEYRESDSLTADRTGIFDFSDVPF